MAEGLRYNEGKLRYDLVQADAHRGMVEVLTFGAKKYAERNWERGMAWSKVISSLKRHIAKIEEGEDYDVESGLLHADHVQCNAHFLSAYYRIYPKGDDRPHKYLRQPKIGLDIDEVIADWVGAMMEKFPNEITERAIHWNSYELLRNFPLVKEDPEFWLNIKPKTSPVELPFEPHCYITARPIPSELTEQWLALNGFPKAPVFTVGHGQPKAEVAKEAGVEIFVDDSYSNFVQLNNAGICTFLFDAPHNQKYNVGFKRIKSLKEIAW
jgi:hypothetical protein